MTMIGRREKQTFGVGRDLFGRPTMPTRFASLMQILYIPDSPAAPR